MYKLLLLFIIIIIKYNALSYENYLYYNQVAGKPYNVTYDKRSFLINGKRTMFISGTLHYPRFSVGQWDNIFKKAYIHGLNMIELYTFWNYHQPDEYSWIWSDNANITHFIELAGKNNLFVNLRIGPYVCAEWTYGGLPVWLLEKEELRDLFSDRGGPIIIGHIENELHTDDTKYIEWCGDIVNSFGINIPWLMCNGNTADNTINSCNGDDCTDWIENHGQNGKILISQPATWTENEGWFQIWGEPQECYDNNECRFPSRPIDKLTYSILRFIARGGSHYNYYMFIGGNNYGRITASSLTTSYAEYVNFHSDSIPNEPKYTVLTNLHEFLRYYSSVIILDNAQLGRQISLPWWDGYDWKIGTEQFAFEYQGNYGFMVFIENCAKVEVQTKYQEFILLMPPESIVVLDSSNNVLFNTSSIPKDRPKRIYVDYTADFKWEQIDEPILETENRPIIINNGLFDALNITKGFTDYLYYELLIDIPNNSKLKLYSYKSMGIIIYIDGKYYKEVNNHEHNEGDINYEVDINNINGLHNITLLLESFGYADGIYPGHPAYKSGIYKIILNNKDISNYKWIHKPYLYGEYNKYYKYDNNNNIIWNKYIYMYNNNIGTKWYKTKFNLPDLSKLSNNNEIVYDVIGLNRGHIYINGRDIGRYWNITKNNKYSQRYYHIPQDWLKVNNNTLVINEITGPVDLSRFKLLISKLPDE